MARRRFLVQGALRNLAGRLVAVGIACGLLAGPALGQDCKADPDWSKDKAPEPAFRAKQDTNCAFHQWAVQEFLYQVQPVDGLARFLGLASPHALFLYKGNKPDSYPGSPATLFKETAGVARLQSQGRSGAPGRIVFLPRTPKGRDTTFDADRQAGSNAVLTDQQGQWVYYTTTINQKYYDFVVDKGYNTLAGFLAAPATTTFPVGTLETKSAWRIAVKEGKTYLDVSKHYTIPARVCKDAACQTYVPATMALVGLHLVGRLEDHPEMVWATFEHQLNAPDCKDTRSADPRYSFYKAGQICGKAPFWETCNQLPDPKDLTTPSEICRVHPQGEPGDKPENVPNIQVLNASFHQILEPGSVWANYDYAGAVWTTGKPGPAGLIALDNASIRGSMKLANTSLESFTQDKNCLHCHTYQPQQMSDKCFPRIDDKNGWKNLYVSHLFSLLCKTAR